MPIKLDKELPALDILREENVFIMDNERAKHQDIRPMDSPVVNLTPTKEMTETQLLRLLANTPLQINVGFLYMTNHESRNTTAERLETSYKTLDDVRHKYYDGLIITSTPVETSDYEEVDYWSELCQIFDWSKTHVYSTLHLCWGAQAGLYYKYGIKKVLLDRKLSGIFSQDVVSSENSIVRGFDGSFAVPHSRYTEVRREDVEKIDDLEVIVASEAVGLSIMTSKDLREVYSFGHLEYDRETLDREYRRDVKVGENPNIPEHYYLNDDPARNVSMYWSLAATTFFSNWINYAVYQETPYSLEELEKDFPFYGYL